MAHVSGAPALPTLLTSRPRPQPDGAKSRADGSRLLLLQEEPRAQPVCVRNTFIDTSAPLSPSLSGFFKEREVSTCPSSRIGLLGNLFQEAAATGTRRDHCSPQSPAKAAEAARP